MGLSSRREDVGVARHFDRAYRWRFYGNQYKSNTKKEKAVRMSDIESDDLEDEGPNLGVSGCLTGQYT